jgi:hypothetical protein
VSPRRLAIPFTTGSIAAARAFAAGTKKLSTMLTPYIPQITFPTDDALMRSRITIAMRRSSFISCIMPPTMKANRQSQITSVVKPAKTVASGGVRVLPVFTHGIACVTIRSKGIEIPVMPTGIASEIHIRDAHTTMAITAMP